MLGARVRPVRRRELNSVSALAEALDMGLGFQFISRKAGSAKGFLRQDYARSSPPLPALKGSPPAGC